MATTTGQDALFSEAEAYERFMGRWSRQLASALVGFAGVGDGDAVLDIGAGTGALAAAVAEAAPSSRIIGIDPAAPYVALAQARHPGDRVRFEVGDAQQMRFADATFDRTLSLLVVNFIPDAAKALDEMRRVTRHGGTVAAAVWDYGDGMQMLRTFWDEAVALNPGSAAKDERNMPFCRAGELGAFWRKRGLEQVVEAGTDDRDALHGIRGLLGPVPRETGAGRRVCRVALAGRAQPAPGTPAPALAGRWSRSAHRPHGPRLGSARHRAMSVTRRVVEDRRCGVAACLLTAASLLASAATGAQDLPRGTVIDALPVSEDPSQSYALYLPSDYAPDRAWSLLLAFHPSARGRALRREIPRRRRALRLHRRRVEQLPERVLAGDHPCGPRDVGRCRSAVRGRCTAGVSDRPLRWRAGGDGSRARAQRHRRASSHRVRASPTRSPERR